MSKSLNKSSFLNGKTKTKDLKFVSTNIWVSFLFLLLHLKLLLLVLLFVIKLLVQVNIIKLLVLKNKFLTSYKSLTQLDVAHQLLKFPLIIINAELFWF